MDDPWQFTLGMPQNVCFIAWTLHPSNGMAGHAWAAACANRALGRLPWGRVYILVYGSFAMVSHFVVAKNEWEKTLRLTVNQWSRSQTKVGFRHCRAQPHPGQWFQSASYIYIFPCIYIYIFDIYIYLHCCTLVTSVCFCILNMHISVLLHFNDVHIKITICLATAPCISIHGCIHMCI